MLYITRYDTEYEPLYSAKIDWRGSTDLIVCDVDRSQFSLCIIDIDEMDACAAALRGDKLWPVIRIERTYDGEKVIVSDPTSIIDYWYEMLWS